MSRDRKKQQKRKARQQRLRREKHERSSPLEDDYVIIEDVTVGPGGIVLPSETALERSLRGLTRRSWLGRLFGRRRSKQEEAQSLAYDAADAYDAEDAVALARQAL